MTIRKQIFCYFWIRVIDQAGQIMDDAARLARAAAAIPDTSTAGNAVVVNPVTNDRLGDSVVVNPVTNDRLGDSVVVNPVTNDRLGDSVVVNPVTNDRLGDSVVVNPVTNDRSGGAVVVNPVTNDRGGGDVTQWTEGTEGSTSITISTVPQGYVVADASAPFTTDYIALNQNFNEESARQWIDTDEGRRWRGNAKVCVLHHAIVTFEA